MNQIESQMLVPVVCLIIGKFLHEWKRFPNWVIPYISFVAGIATNCIAKGLSGPSFVEGLFLGAAATGLHQAVNQTRIKDPQ